MRGVLLSALTVLTALCRGARAQSSVEMLTFDDDSHLLNGTCEELRQQLEDNQRSLILNATLAAAEQWADMTSALSYTCISLDVVMIVLLVAFRHHRPVQSAGLGFLLCLLTGCIFGHLASLTDAFALTAASCRGRLALIYLFIFFLVAPISGKVASLCRVARNASLAGNASGWDLYAKKCTLVIVMLEVIILVFYLGITAGKPYREDRLQTVCSEKISEHAFHMFDGLLIGALILGIFAMIAWLQMTSLVTAKRGTKDLLLCAITSMLGSGGLLSLLAASSQDVLSISMASAITPVRLCIILLVAWVHVGFQVVPALFLTFQLLFERKFNPHGRRRVNRMRRSTSLSRSSRNGCLSSSRSRRAPARPPREPVAAQTDDIADPAGVGMRTVPLSAAGCPKTT